MSFVCVQPSDKDKIKQIYDTLRACGEDMLLNQNLHHWENPYSEERIVEDCKKNNVFAVYRDGQIIATFQIGITEDSARLSKFAVLPQCSGQGIGSQCLEFAENFCIKKKQSSLCLDVYDQSLIAIRFYEKNGYETVGSALTRRFRVLFMEKNIL